MGMWIEIIWDIFITSDGPASFLVELQVLGAIKNAASGYILGLY